MGPLHCWKVYCVSTRFNCPIIRQPHTIPFISLLKAFSSPLPAYLSYKPVLLRHRSHWTPTFCYLGAGLFLLHPLPSTCSGIPLLARPHQHASRIQISCFSYLAALYSLLGCLQWQFPRETATLLSLPFTLNQVSSCSSVNHAPKLPQFHLRDVKHNGHVLSFSNFQNGWLPLLFKDTEAPISSHDATCSYGTLPHCLLLPACWGARLHT